MEDQLAEDGNVLTGQTIYTAAWRQLNDVDTRLSHPSIFNLQANLRNSMQHRHGYIMRRRADLRISWDSGKVNCQVSTKRECYWRLQQDTRCGRKTLPTGLSILS